MENLVFNMMLNKILFIFFLGAAFGVPFEVSLAADSSSGQGLPDTLNSFDEAFEGLRDERDALRAEVANLKAEKNAEAETVKIRIGAIEEQKRKSDEALESAENKIAQLEAENQDLNGKIDGLETEVNRFKDLANSKDSAAAGLKDESVELKTNLAQAERALARASEKIQKAQVTKENLEKELGLLRQERKKALFGHEDELALLKEEKEKIASRLESAEAQVKMLQAKIGPSDLKEALLRKNGKNVSPEANKTLKERFAQLEKKYEVVLYEKKKEAGQAADTVRLLADKIKGLKDEQRKEDQQHKKQLEASADKIKELTAKLTSCSQAFQVCSDEMAKIKKEKDELSKKKGLSQKPVVRLR
jgi:chromosome segregation ATPase